MHGWPCMPTTAHTCLYAWPCVPDPAHVCMHAWPCTPTLVHTPVHTWPCMPILVHTPVHTWSCTLDPVAAPGEALSSLLSAILAALQPACGVILAASLAPQGALRIFDFLGNTVLEEVQATLAAEMPGECLGARKGVEFGGGRGRGGCEGRKGQRHKEVEEVQPKMAAEGGRRGREVR